MRISWETKFEDTFTSTVYLSGLQTAQNRVAGPCEHRPLGRTVDNSTPPEAISARTSSQNKTVGSYQRCD